MKEVCTKEGGVYIIYGSDHDLVPANREDVCLQLKVSFIEGCPVVCALTKAVFVILFQFNILWHLCLVGTCISDVMFCSCRSFNYTLMTDKASQIQCITKKAIL